MMKRYDIRRLTRAALTALTCGLMAATGFAGPGAPNFNPALWGDGRQWGTKGTTSLPAPNEHNKQSFDALFIVTNSNNPDGQLPVSEAAPGNVHYNGGRWIAYTAWWTEEGFAAYGTVPVLTSYADILVYYMLGYLDFVAGPPNENVPAYFQCPLLPVK